ncbi:MAG: T9SS type A sorting domain-containing protein, partial [Flavobacteriales bacterium]
YVRFYSIKQSKNDGLKIKRFGQMRFEWMAGPLPYPTWVPSDRPTNCDPCGAVALTVDAACTTTMVSGGSTVGACSVPGIPFPTCGGFSAATQSVWHKFIAPLSGTVQIDAKGTAPVAISPAIALYTSNDQGCGGRMALLACDDRQGPGPDARIIKYGLVPGQTYYIRTWSRTSEGTFSLCVSEPRAPTGSCLYMIDLWALNPGGNLSMDVSINGGPVTTYTPSGGESSQSFLIPIPLGAYADFAIHGTSSMYFFYGLWQVGQPELLWWDDGGYAVIGPSPPPVTTYHLASACQPIVHPSTDCRGMRTICLSNAGSTHPVTGVIENRPKPRRNGPTSSSSSNSQNYNGYTYNVPNGNAYDLAGANMGCLSPEQNGIEWLVFRPEMDGTVAFLLNATKTSPPPSGSVDLDFAIWDLGELVYDPDENTTNGDLVCPPSTAPLRCSSARFRGSTGLVAGMPETYEGNGGWGWLKPLPVLENHGYLIALMPVDTIGRIDYTLDWTIYKNAAGVSDANIINCETLILPVELLFLAAQQRENVVDLTWATATEKNSSEFIVERSTNAFDFTPIGKVAASGDSQYRIDYAFTDQNPLGGVNYYRLQLVDRDGSTETSNAVAVMFTGDGSRVLAWPNPTRDRLNVGADLRGQNMVQVQVVDALGRLILRSEVLVESGQDRVEVDTQRLAAGSYMVHLSGSTGMPIGTAHFVKE